MALFLEYGSMRRSCFPDPTIRARSGRHGTDITFNVMNGFMLAYGTQQLGLPRRFFLNAILVGCAVELFTLPLFGKLSEHIGRRKVYLMGAVFVALYGFLFFSSSKRAIRCT